jgi:two-component system LytT family response regulator
MKIQALIVDDEPPARSKLRRLLEKDGRVEIVGEARDGADALNQIASTNPTHLFLDIQMPRLNGFEVLDALGPERPQIIFTTAYDQYAIKAFEVRALDYLLKPFDEKRLREAIDRAVEGAELEDSSVNQRIDSLLRELRERKPLLRRILLRTEGRIIFIDTRHIVRISSEEKYVRLHIEGKSYLHRETMNNLAQRLDPSVFARVHRQEIVNMNFVRELESLSHGDYEILMRDGTRVPLGRTYKGQFLERFSAPPD